MEEKFQLVSPIEDEDEEFYEKIEAPKFVDFTLPNHFCPDDRFWFCSRVGCDQRHEEEMDSEAIYKNFVLRVMAARSPNVRFRRAITRKPPSESKKFPLSAPPKPSKSRLPRLALVASSISKKLKLPPANVNPASTPKARVKHVAAKYMTSPRKKKGSSPNPNAFRSARNPKKPSISLPQSKVVAKALVFNSPNKAALKRKVSEELSTPITLLCEGVKKLQINTQKKGVNRTQSKDVSEELITPITLLCEGVRKLQINTQKKGVNRTQSKDCTSGLRRKNPRSNVAKTREFDAKFSKSVKSSRPDQPVGPAGFRPGQSLLSKTKTNLVAVNPRIEERISSGEEGTSSSENSEVVSVNSQKSEMNSGKDSDSKVSEEENFTAIQELKEDEQSQEIGKNGDNIDKEKGSDTQKRELNSGSNSDSKVSAEENSVAITESNVDEKEKGNLRVVSNFKDSDDKENALNSDNIRILNGNNLSKQNLPVKLKVKTKQNPQKLDKISKENCPAGTGTQTLKNRKLKPTNPKPFRLRTDERGILKEATLERKVNYFENSSTASENSEGTGNAVTDNKEKGTKKGESRSFKKDQLAFQKPIKSRYKMTSKEVEPKSEKTSGNQKLARPQREIVSRVKSQGLDANQKSETTMSSPKEPRKQGTSAAHKLAAQGKRTVTIPREPKFHSLHKPKGCIRNKP